jgi:hypothetical protein
MNKEQQELLDDVYENYSKEYEKDNSIGMCRLVARTDGKSTYHKPHKEMFIDLCQHDKTFSQRWGLKIEERELSLEERETLLLEIDDTFRTSTTQEIKLVLDEYNIPTKLITITYNDKTIESYE